MLDFPNTPQVDDLFPDPAIPGVPQWRWDGAKWVSVGVAAVADAPIDGKLWGRRDGNWSPVEDHVQSLSDLVINQQFFTASGTYIPTPGLIYAIVECMGGGGGGGWAWLGANACAGGGGGSGGYTRAGLSAAQIGASQNVTVGGGGPPMAGGGQTIFGSTGIYANGGTPGAYSDSNTAFGGGGVGGGPAPLPAGVTGLAISGNAGGTGIITAAYSSLLNTGMGGSDIVLAIPGVGGSLWGGAPFLPQIGVNQMQVGTPGAFASGAGGNGGAGNFVYGVTVPGGTGGSGWCCVTEYCFSQT